MCHVLSSSFSNGTTKCLFTHKKLQLSSLNIGFMSALILLTDIYSS